MTITVSIHWQEGEFSRDETVTVSPAAEEAIRVKFNPSGRIDVEVLNALAAALWTKCDSDPYPSTPGREFAIARTEVETAAMWAVKGATKGT